MHETPRTVEVFVARQACVCTYVCARVCVCECIHNGHVWVGGWWVKVHTQQRTGGGDRVRRRESARPAQAGVDFERAEAGPCRKSTIDGHYFDKSAGTRKNRYTFMIYSPHGVRCEADMHAYVCACETRRYASLDMCVAVGGWGCSRGVCVV